MEDSVNKTGEFYHKSFDIFRLIILLCAICFHYSLRISLEVTRYAFGFAVPAVFLVSGYLVSGRTEAFHGRIKRTLLRSGLAFVLLTVAYLIFSYIFSPESTLAEIQSKDFWVNFLVMGQWRLPPSVMLWYVQALFYSYFVLFILDKLNLLKFDLIIAGILLVFSAFTGEFAGLINFNILGYKYISSNFITIGLPFILIGGYLRRNKKFLFGIRRYVFDIVALFGLLLTYVEYFVLSSANLLVYKNRYIGCAITALAVCGWFFKYGELSEPKGFTRLDRWDINTIFYVFPFINYIFSFYYGSTTLILFLSFILSFAGIPIRHLLNFLKTVVIWNIKSKKAYKAELKREAEEEAKNPPEAEQE